MLDNVSAGGLYVRLPQRLVVGVRVFAMLDLAVGPAPVTRGLPVAVCGCVVCTALHPDGRYVVGV